MAMHEGKISNFDQNKKELKEKNGLTKPVLVFGEDDLPKSHEKKEKDEKISNFDEMFLIEVLKEIEPFLRDLVYQLKKNIENDKYDVLLGDDASGRILTLILMNVINKFKERNGIKRKIITKFIAGGKGSYWNWDKETKARELLEKMNLKDKKVLIVTEYIFNGNGLFKIAKLLKEIGVDFDCAVLASRFKKKYYLKRFPIFKRENFFVADEFRNFSIIYGEHEIAGVRKENYEDVLAKKYNYFSQKTINFSRKLVQELSEKIVNNIWKENNK